MEPGLDLISRRSSLNGGVPGPLRGGRAPERLEHARTRRPPPARAGCGRRGDPEQRRRPAQPSSERARRRAVGPAPVEPPFLFEPPRSTATRSSLRLSSGAGAGAVNVAEVLEGKRVCICAGSGGVGKTTTSAAIAMGMAAGGAEGRRGHDRPGQAAGQLARPAGAGQRAAARRPRALRPARDRDGGRAVGDDARRQAHVRRPHRAPGARRAGTRDEILANRIYQQLSSAVAGSQEYTAMAKLYELDREGGFDLIVLDTPPSRNALDFLDAPDRLTRFLEGRALQVFLRPTGLAAPRRRAGHGSRVLRAQARHRRRPARRTCRCSSARSGADRRLHRARAEQVEGAAGRPGHDVPDGHLARARADRRGDLLLASVSGRGACRSAG